MANPFLESPRFPEVLSYSSKGGPRFSTTVVPVASGFENRNRNWVYPLYEYDASKATQSPAEMELLLSFFSAMGGKYYGFRFKDPLDFKSCAYSETVSYANQVLGVGNGSNKVFQLIKKYTAGAVSQTRKILKPVVGTVSVGVNGVLQSSGWTVDTTTGVVTFVTAPSNGYAVTAGFEFDVPVRFDSDKLLSEWESYGSLSTDAMLIEDRL
jgi:uncharacterized protein (TIGR02217 family)